MNVLLIYIIQHGNSTNLYEFRGVTQQQLDLLHRSRGSNDNKDRIEQAKDLYRSVSDKHKRPANVNLIEPDVIIITSHLEAIFVVSLNAVDAFDAEET